MSAIKKLGSLAGTALLAFTLSGCDDGGMLDPNTPDGKSDAVMRLNATGIDLRVYEFTPQTAPNTQCVFVSGDRKGGLYCFPKPQP